ncbi:MAG: IS66 family insertion sequence element accessory protein TnpB [Candidatus Competibacteraceae bacterium]
MNRCKVIWDGLYVFRNRTGTTLKLLCYDGQGYWLYVNAFPRLLFGSTVRSWTGCSSQS